MMDWSEEENSNDLKELLPFHLGDTAYYLFKNEVDIERHKQSKKKEVEYFLQQPKGYADFRL